MTSLFIAFLSNLSPWVFWLAIAVVFLIVEAVTEALMSIWFAIGAFVAMLFALLNLSFGAQIAAMIVVSAALLAIFLKNRDKMHLTSPFKSATNADRVIGEYGEVVQTIHPVDGTGQVKVRGTVWSAFTDDGHVLLAGTTVQVIEIRGVKLLVAPIQQPHEAPEKESL